VKIRSTIGKGRPSEFTICRNKRRKFRFFDTVKKKNRRITLTRGQGYGKTAQRLALCPLGYWWAGVDSAWEQKKLEARKMPENAAESPASSALSRCTSGTLC
jgi:hypothetical protein